MLLLFDHPSDFGRSSIQSAENHRIFPSLFRTQQSRPLEFESTPFGLISLRLMFDRSKLESLRDASVTRIDDTFPTVFRRLYYFKALND